MKKKILIPLLLLIIILAGYMFYIHSEPVVKVVSPEEEVSIESSFEKTRGKLNTNIVHYVKNIPVVYIENSGYVAGVQHGKLLKKEINEVVNTLYEDVVKTNTPKGFLAKTYLLQKAKQLDKHIPQTYREEMKGIARAAGVSYNDILLINTYDDLLHLAKCSSIAVSKNDKNSLFFHARNLDYTIDVLSDKNIIFHYPDEEFISVGFPGYIGTLSATNYNGLSLSSHTSTVTENEIGMPSGLVYRKIMEEATTLFEAENILKNSHRTIGNNLLVSSLDENKAAVFEITANKVITSIDDHAITTNHFVSKELASKNKSYPNSKKRYNYLTTCYQNMEEVNADKIKEIMSYYKKDEKGWTSVANKGTVQGVIFLPEQKKLYVASGTETPVTLSGYTEYDFSLFFDGDKIEKLKFN